MKKLLYALFAFVAIVACTKSDDGGGADTPPSNPEKPQTEININITTLDFNAEGGTVAFAFSTNEAWTAELINDRADEWCSIEPTSGTAGSAEIAVTTTANDTPDDRSASIVIKAGTVSKTITVNQKQKDALTTSASKFVVSNEGGEVSIEVKANVDFDYAIEQSAKDWIEYKGTRSLKTYTLTFAVAENGGVEKREAKIYITSGGLSEVVTIYQVGSEPLIVVSQNEYVVPAGGGTLAVEVMSNVAVEVDLPADAEWVTENITRGVSTNTYYFDIAPNLDYDQRTAEITFYSEENSLSETVRIVQGQRNAIVVAKDEYSLDSNGGNLQIEVGYNVDFDVNISADWITKTVTRAFASKTITFHVAKNTSGSNRQAKITFRSKDGLIMQTVKVIQNKEIIIALAQNIYTIESEGGQIIIEVDHNVDLDVAIDGDWISRSSTRAIESDTFVFDIAGNTSTKIRTGKITFSSKDGLLKQMVEVCQYGATDNTNAPNGSIEGMPWG